MTDQTIPYDVDIEQALLGACMRDEEALQRAEVEVSDFYDSLHRKIWEVIEQKRAAAERCSPITIHAVLSDNSMMQEVGGRDYLVNLTRAAPAMPHIEGYTKILSDLAARRHLIWACEEDISEAIAAPLDTDSQALLARHEDKIHAIQMGTIRADDPVPWDQTGGEVIDRMGSKSSTAVRLQPYGIPELDNEIGGMGPGDLIIIGGRPGMGKSAIALTIAHAAARPKEQMRLDLEPTLPPQAVGVFLSSLEMERHQLVERSLSMAAFAKHHKIPYSIIRLQRLSDSQKNVLADVYIENRGLPLEIDDRRGLRLGQIGVRMRRAQARFKRAGTRLGLGIIDHLGLIEPDADYRGNKVAELTATTRGLKILAGALGIPLIVLCQLSRAVETREDKRPYLSDLRESGSIEQDADVVILLHRPEYYLIKSKPEDNAPQKDRDAWHTAIERETNRLNLYVPKNRNGAEASIRLTCHMAYNSIGGV